jgi:hypothetical protein
MPALAITLVRPADHTRLAGSGVLRLTAALAAPAPVPLFYKWYSSAAADPLGTALDLPAANLPLGSQVITFSAKDQAADTPAALQAVVFAGMAGGPKPDGQACRVHVLRAGLRQPAAGASLSRASATLAAEAPPRWARKIPPALVYETDPDHQALNRLRFRWRFSPLGAPAGRASADLLPSLAQWQYVPPPGDNSAPPLLRYSGPLPGGLGTGSYQLTLRVEDKDDAGFFHEQSVTVSLT